MISDTKHTCTPIQSPQQSVIVPVSLGTTQGAHLGAAQIDKEAGAPKNQGRHCRRAWKVAQVTGAQIPLGQAWRLGTSGQLGPGSGRVCVRAESCAG